MIDNFRDEYYILSNFYPCTVTYEGLTYQCAETAFQAQKCKDVDKRRLFTILNATEAKKKGRSIELRPDWEHCKVRIMEEIVRHKFQQNAELREILADTNNLYLEEGNTWGIVYGEL